MRPIVVIVGRPNVGKSTLLNRLAGRRVAIVEDEPGVTRDRLFVDCRMNDRELILVDTGGLDQAPDDELTRLTMEQAHLAVEEADLILFLCDGRDGLQAQDRTVANVLRKSGKPFICLINKCDPGARYRESVEFHELGMDFLEISAAHGSGLDDMFDQVDSLLEQAGFPGEPEAVLEPEEIAEEEADPEAEQAEKKPFRPDRKPGPLRMCLLGRPNVGKSSLANRLAGESRQMVSEVAGTTRDAVDITIGQGDDQVLLVDTPGVRRKGRISDKVERYSVLAALRSLERADVAVVVIDGGEPFADQDARLLRLAHDRGRGLVVVVNKSDLWSGDDRKKYLADLKYGMRFVAYAPVVVLSALSGKGVKGILPAVRVAFRSAGMRITTGDLNQVVAAALERQQPPVIKGRRAKIFYITQAGVFPPLFIAWVNDPRRLPTSYRRYLDHQFRGRFPFEGTPLRLLFKSRKGERKKKKGRSKSRKGGKRGRKR